LRREHEGRKKARDHAAKNEQEACPFGCKKEKPGGEDCAPLSPADGSSGANSAPPSRPTLPKPSEQALLSTHTCLPVSTSSTIPSATKAPLSPRRSASATACAASCRRTCTPSTSN